MSTHLRSNETSQELVSESGVTSAIFKLSNTAADQEYFVTTATPEGAITGSIGDIATDTVTGTVYVKATGTATNTGWSALLSASTGAQDSFFQTSNPLSLAFGVTRYIGLNGNSLVATETLVSMPQFSGTYNGMKVKVISNTCDGATLIKLRKNATNAGPAISVAAAGTGVSTDTTSTTVAADDLLDISIDTSASTTGTIVIAGIMTRCGVN